MSIQMLDLLRKNPTVTSLGTEGYRTIFTGFSDFEAAVEQEGFMNPKRRLSLNGTWDFSWIKNVDTVSFETDSESSINVPSNWQLCGHDIPIYTNSRYPFDKSLSEHGYLAPPSIPEEENSAAVYRKYFSCPEITPEDRILLRFLGVESCFYLQVNKKFVGYHANTFSPAEFDITEYVDKEKENEICVVVYRYCAASWLEDQDMWRMSGIFRDVELIVQPCVSIFDFQIETWPERNNKSTLKARIKIKNYTAKACDPCYADMRLFDAEGNELTTLPEHGYTGMENPDWPVDTWRKYDTREGFSGQFEEHAQGILGNTIRTVYLKSQFYDLKLWTAETPYLYTVYFSLYNQDGTVLDVVKYPVGIRRVDVMDSQICVNEKPIKLKGVNYHEFDPVTGRAICYERMREDLILMKRANINAVRCSHYPHHPRFYELCDQIGLYVMDECNLETHGISYKADVLPGNDGRWTACCIDRAAGMLEVSKNHPSVIIYSTSNEAGYGENIQAMAAWLRSRDSGRLIHERQMSVIADMESDTYPGIEWIRQKLEKKEKKPYLLNEYAHAMGNAMGNLEDYWKVIKEYDHAAGGFIWEWCDQGLRRQTDQGTTIYAYGGDYGDVPNSANFCIDGVVTPERELTPKYREVQAVYQYIDTQWEAASGSILIHNGYYHTNMSDIFCEWKLLQDGVIIKKQTLFDLCMIPGETRKYKLDFPPFEKEKEYFLELCFYLKTDTPWAEKNICVAREQHLVKKAEPMKHAYAKTTGVVLEETETYVLMQTKQTEIRVRKKDGKVCLIKQKNVLLLDKSRNEQEDIHITISRAYTDNDRHSVFYLQENGWKQQKPEALKQKSVQVKSHISPDGPCILVSACYETMPNSGLNQYTVFRMSNSGDLCADFYLQPFGKITALPRIGFECALNGNFQNQFVKWYGRGSHESYPDRKKSALLGIYNGICEKNMYYMCPQEYGSHQDVRWLQLADTFLYMEEPFSFAFRKESDRQLRNIKHMGELTDENMTWLYLDFAQCGLGNASCGTEVMPAYLLSPKPVSRRVYLSRESLEQWASPIDLKQYFKIDESKSIFLEKETQQEFFDPSDQKAREKAGF